MPGIYVFKIQEKFSSISYKKIDVKFDSNLYLDISSVIKDENGYLPDDAATDGIHLNKNYCDKWLQYLKTHYIVEN